MTVRSWQPVKVSEEPLTSTVPPLEYAVMAEPYFRPLARAAPNEARASEPFAVVAGGSARGAGRGGGGGGGGPPRAGGPRPTDVARPPGAVWPSGGGAAAGAGAV